MKVSQVRIKLEKRFSPYLLVRTDYFKLLANDMRYNTGSTVCIPSPGPKTSKRNTSRLRSPDVSEFNSFRFILFEMIAVRSDGNNSTMRVLTGHKATESVLINNNNKNNCFLCPTFVTNWIEDITEYRVGLANWAKLRAWSDSFVQDRFSRMLLYNF